MIESHKEVQVGLLSVSGIIPKTVQTEVSKTGSNLLIQASTIASLKGIFSSKF